MNDTTSEIWVDVPGWEKSYQVSNCGNVRSLDRKITCLNPYGVMKSRKFKGRLLTVAVTTGYPVVTFVRPGKREQFYVHDLVLRAFKCSKPKGLEVCHNDGNRKNNRLQNLRYDTRSANALDRHKHGTFNVPSGVDHPHSRLTISQVNWIRKNQKRFSFRELGRRFGVSHNTIAGVVYNRSYI